MAKHPALLRGFVEPLTIAALNTPVAEASSARLGQVLRRLGRYRGRLGCLWRAMGWGRISLPPPSPRCDQAGADHSPRRQAARDDHGRGPRRRPAPRAQDTLTLDAVRPV